MVAAAVIANKSGQVLVQQRPPGTPMAGLWEFPGGKLEAGETPEAALARELLEELGIAVETNALVPLSFTFASAALGEDHLLLLLYRLDQWQGEPAAHHATALAWVTPTGLRALPMPPADLPFIAILEAAFSPSA